MLLRPTELMLAAPPTSVRPCSFRGVEEGEQRARATVGVTQEGRSSCSLVPQVLKQRIPRKDGRT